MPLYSYKCGTCNEVYDIKRSFEESSLEALCDKCHTIMIRQWGNIGVQFNGSGFYSTDNRKK